MKKKMTTKKKVIIAVIVVVVLGPSIYMPYSKGVFTPVNNGWEAGDDYTAEITDYGVPAEYEAECDEPGTLENITYEVESCQDTSIKSEKTAQVYLPYGYDESQEYNIIYILHGTEDDGFAGDYYKAWLETHPNNKNLTDNLIANEDIDPVIIVSPTAYYPEEFGYGDEFNFEQFAYEMRYNLIPAIESKYATYAKGDVSEENIVATREHRAFAGLSAGSRHTINVGMMQMLDEFAWFGSFSGAQTEASDIFAALHSEKFEQYEISGLMVTNGKYDKSYEEHTSTMGELVAMDDKLTEGENYCYIEVVNGSHMWPLWELSLYDFLQYAFN